MPVRGLFEGVGDAEDRGLVQGFPDDLHSASRGGMGLVGLGPMKKFSKVTNQGLTPCELLDGLCLRLRVCPASTTNLCFVVFLLGKLLAD